MQRSFTYKQATITIHRRRTADQLDAQLVIAAITGDTSTFTPRQYMRHWNRAKTYGITLASIDRVEGDAGFPIPAPDATEAELIAGYEAWLNDDGFYDAWLTAMNAVNAPIGDPDTAPGVDNDPNE